MNKRIIFSDKSDSLLQSYFRDISKYKILDNEEINKLIVDLMKSFTPESQENELEEIKTTINDYNKLKVILTNKIGRIRSTYY